MQKKAEHQFTDADKFPSESFREVLSRQYGVDAVALSGPCEGQNLVDCVVNQLSKRWDRIQSRYAGDTNKAIKLARKLAESYQMKDDTKDCIKELESIGYNPKAAAGIGSYLKAFAMPLADNQMVKEAMGEIYAEDPMAPAADPMMGDPAAPAPADQAIPELDHTPDDMNGGMDDGMGMGMGDDLGAPEAPEMGVEPAAEGTVTIELPMEVAEQLKDAIETQAPDAGMGMDDGGLGIEVVDMDSPEGMGGDVEEFSDEVVPGEPEGGMEDHEVEGVGKEEAGGGMGGMGGGMGGGGAMPAMGSSEHKACPSCGHMASEGHEGEEHGIISELAKAVHNLESGEEQHHEGKQSPETHEKKEHENIEKLDKGVDKFKSEEGMGGKSEDKGGEEEHASKHAASEQKKLKLAAANMRQGHIRAVGINKSALLENNDYEKKTPTDYNSPIKNKAPSGDIARLGNPMRMNNTDQLLHMEGKELGEAKDKTPDEPKPIFEGNLEVEGFSAGDSKFQDGSTMGHEPKFDPHKIAESEYTGGKSSLMGKDESFPDQKPEVPAGSSPIGNEPWTGGDLATKGTVIATITPKGVIVEANGKKFRAKGEIKQANVAKIQEGLNKLTFDGDAYKFAEAAVKVIKEAAEGGEKSGLVDNVTKIDTSKLEAEKFTNDAKKEPVEGGAMTEKGKGEDQHKAKDIVKIDTSKLESEKFTNDADKKPESEEEHRGYAATEGKTVKTAEPDEKATPKTYNHPVNNSGDKAVEKPKALEDGNVHSEGFTAGGDKFSDGKTMGHEPKFDPHKIADSEFTGGDSSLLGKDESRPTDTAKVPAGKGQMGHETQDGGDLSTKGTTIAEDNSTKRQVSAEEVKNEATIREARLKAASVYCADLLAHGDISRDDYTKELEKVSSMSVQAIQNLIAHTKQLRARIENTNKLAQKAAAEGKTGGLSIPIVIASNNNETSLKDRLIREFKLTRTLDSIDEMKK